jgi:hypothetical protein
MKYFNLLVNKELDKCEGGGIPGDRIGIPGIKIRNILKKSLTPD